ncbi:cyanophycinase [Leptolyngbya sp. 7M]|uniref:cyanophycinase n=1 Tax=Leptolyngbya sp. 7M TaxID=2812896 RepID=UPI001B8C6C33|nr:cyanophycinase [Leptolyngbya sp. 7M]QYO62368.1 cyanophycinase [Leptolyngbya sp. 7M]
MNTQAQAFRNLGIANPRVLRATSRQDVFQANADGLLDGITGVFMTGGDQMRLVSLLGGTEFAAKLRKMVRETPIVLAGTSAGAAGMSTSMIVRGESTSHPHKGAVQLSPGLGFLKNIIIDQHFTERGRISRLITAVSYNPYNLGIGIDENTAIILDGKGVLEVIGRGSVTIVDGSCITYNEIAEVAEHESFSICGVQMHILRDGLIYDYLKRHPLQPPQEFLLPDLG